MRSIVFLFFPIIIFSQEKVGIYNISFSILPNLLQEYRVQTHKGISSNGVYNLPISSNLNYSASKVQIAEFLYDSVRIAIKKMVGVVLNSKASCIFQLNKQNEPISHSGFGTNTKVIQQEILSSDIIFSMLKETMSAYKKKYLNQE